MYQRYNCLTIGLDYIYDELVIWDYRTCDSEETLKINFTWLNELRETCSNEICLPNCTEQIYQYQVVDSTEMLDEEISSDTIIINLIAKNDDELTYIYQPKITHSDLMSNFGGLLSFWLGYSIYETYCHFGHLFGKLFRMKVSLIIN